jgi:hypothetical protein
MEDEKKTVVKKTVKSGITFGSALAMIISYTAWHSIGWAFSTACSAGPTCCTT